MYLGHIISKDGVKVDPAKTKAVDQYPVPTDVGGLRSFLGMANFFRKFVQGYSQMCAPLTKLLRKDAPFIWGPEQQTAFESIKAALTNAPVLALPDWQDAETPYVLITDASYNARSNLLLLIKSLLVTKKTHGSPTRTTQHHYRSAKACTTRVLLYASLTWVTYVQSFSRSVIRHLMLHTLAGIKPWPCCPDVFGGLVWLRMLPNMWHIVTVVNGTRPAIKFLLVCYSHYLRLASHGSL